MSSKNLLGLGYQDFYFYVALNVYVDLPKDSQYTQFDMQKYNSMLSKNQKVQWTK